MSPENRRRTAGARKQAGAATLIVVMVLFFIISMVAAYTSRNLIFEQRTSANQYRSTMAFEAADAGLEWGIAQLNAGRMTDSCAASTDDASLTDRSFRSRYFSNIDSVTGALTVRAATGAGSVFPRCTFDSSDDNPENRKWSCYCPKPDQANTFPSAASSDRPTPGFVFQMRPVPGTGGRPDLVEMRVASCSRSDSTCVNFNANGSSGDSVSLIRSIITLRGALTRLPSAPLTLSGSLGSLPAGSTLTLQNSDTASNGLTLHVGGGWTGPSTAIPPGLLLRGLPGTPVLNTAVLSDSMLIPAATTDASLPLSQQDRIFATFFGMLPAVYLSQPGLPILDCSTSCDSAAVNLALARNPGRPVWLKGPSGVVNIDADIGIATTPALLIVEGNISISDGVSVKGLIYGRKPSWTIAATGSATINGAIVGEGSMTLAGSTASAVVIYDSAILTTLRVSYGTFVRVPGGWKDFAADPT